MIKRLVGFILSLLIIISFTACQPSVGDSVENDSTDESIKGEEVMYTKSDYIKSVKNVGYMSGRLMEGHDESWAVLGTDLGHTFYDPETDTVYFAHGDTFNSEDPGTPTLWRSNVLAYKKNISEWDFSKGFLIDGYVPTISGNMAGAVIEGKHNPGVEVTKIPRGGVVIDGVFYMWYMSVGTWEPAWVNNYSGVVKSTDKGQTWERVYDLTWFRSSTERVDISKALAEENIYGGKSGVKLDVEGRIAPNFMQMYPVDGKDGYVYIFGTHEGIHCTGKLCRVKYEDIEDFDSYEYFISRDEQGNAIWKKGRTGLNAVKQNGVGEIISFEGSAVASMGEAGGICWNEYLGKWVMSYHINNANIMYRVSDTLWGKWSNAMTILDLEDYPFPNGAERTYGGFSHEVLMRENGKKMYVFVSTWKPYNVCVMEVEFF